MFYYILNKCVFTLHTICCMKLDITPNALKYHSFCLPFLTLGLALENKYMRIYFEINEAHFM